MKGKEVEATQDYDCERVGRRDISPGSCDDGGRDTLDVAEVELGEASRKGLCSSSLSASSSRSFLWERKQLPVFWPSW
jgi:hypothetical protein